MNPYEMLNVPATASEQQIKSAYRRRARETHPDAGGDGDEFSLVSRAYAILMDPDLRKQFDETGSTDDVAPLTVRQRMIQIIVDMFNQALAIEGQRGTSLKHFPLMSKMRDQMAENVKAVRDNAAGHAKALADRKLLLARITRKGDGENLFATIIRDQLKTLEPMVKQSALDVKAMDMAVEELVHYDNEVDLIQAVQMMQYGGSFASQNATSNSVFAFDQAFLDAIMGMKR
jgi:curved DNA-binding protein CbpA